MPRELQRVTGSTAEELAKYEFKAVVLSRNTLGSEWVYKAGIPIINERLMHWMLSAPHHKNLRTLWHVGEERRYLPKEGKHYTYENRSIVEFGGVRFLGERTGLIPQGCWEPSQDIDLAGLA